jgi:hypothetical protein
MDSQLFGLKEWSLIAAPIAVMWIMLAVWLARTRANRWIKASMVGAIAVITVSWIPLSVQSICDARRLETARVEQERAATALLRQLKLPKLPALDQGK